MKSIRSRQYLTAILLLGLALTGPAGAKDLPAKPTVVTRTTKETGPDGRTTERTVLTEQNGDGTITRIVQVVHPDGTTDTHGERIPIQQKG